MGNHSLNRLRPYRPDITGLRALAIAMVVSMHVGIVDIHGGVDVSFVLSGFLNTLILFREIDKTGRINVRGFLAKRFRRLVPGAVVVIGLALCVVWRFTPLQFKSVATDASLAAISGLNWRLVEQGTDYFAADGTQTPFQHYWSLCIEEQFYLLLPLALMLLAWVSRKLFKNNRAITIAIMSAVIVWSFYECIRLTTVNQPLAYFGSYTRVWELGAGALLALCAAQVSRMNQVVAAILSWVGLATIVVTGLLITEKTPLPGYAVLGPVLGTLMVIAGGCAAPKFGPEWLLGHWFTKIIADNSYALYLTHWPILLLWEPVTGHVVATLSDKLKVVVVSFLLSVVIYYPFMKRIQLSQKLVRRPHFNLVGFGGLTTSAAAIALVASLWAPLNIPTTTASAANRVTQGVGAPAVVQAVDLEQLPGNVQPALVDAPKDKAYPSCIVDLDIKRFAPNSDCVVGHTASKRTVVLFGDSHAWQWASAFDKIGREQDLRVVLVAKSGCSPETYTIQSPYFKREYTECDLWRRSAISAIAAMKPEAVVVTGRVRKETTRAGIEDTLGKLRATGAKLVYMTDTPYPGINIPNCLASKSSHVSSCNRTAEDAVQFPKFRLLEVAVAKEYGADVINVVPAFCTDSTCPSVIDDQIVYVDDSHLSATFSKSMATWLSPQIEAALR